MITSDSFFHAVHKLGFELVVMPHLIMQSDCGKGEHENRKNHSYSIEEHSVK